MRGVLVVAAVAGVLLSGCGTGRTPWASSAESDVHQRSVNAGFAMAKAGRHDSAVEHARRVVGEIHGAVEIVLMEAEGTGVDGFVVLRISSVYDDDGPLDDDSSARACYRYDFSDSSGGTQPREVGCPDTAPLELPPPPFVPVLPQDVLDRLERVLGSPDAAARARGAFPERGVTVQVAQQDGALGIAVGAGPGDCVMGRRLARGQVEVWHVPRVVALPGEIGCDPAAAAAGLAKEPPH